MAVRVCVCARRHMRVSVRASVRARECVINLKDNILQSYNIVQNKHINNNDNNRVGWGKVGHVG